MELTMTQFSVKKNLTLPKWILSILLPIAFLSLFVLFSSKIRLSGEAEQTAILERALARTITECYALDGAYPPDLDYLVSHYGLVYDSSRYFIDYQYIGSNIRPDVTVIRRKEDSRD